MKIHSAGNRILDCEHIDQSKQNVRREQSRQQMTTVNKISDSEYADRQLLISTEFPSANPTMPLEMEPVDGSRCAIKCPFCAQTIDMHQDAYEIYARDSEDGKATRIAVDNAGCPSPVGGFNKLRETRLLIEKKDSNSAPGNRDSLAVRFLCTNCNRVSVLHIHQHEGAAMVWFEDPREEVISLDE